MDLDATFRPFVVAGFVIIILIVLPYRLRSRATGETLDRTQEGVPMLITLRVAGIVLWLSVFMFMIDPARMAWAFDATPVVTAMGWRGARPGGGDRRAVDAAQPGAQPH